MPSYRDSYITRVALGIFFLIVVIYGYFEARGLLFGPTISITALPATTNASYVLIEGQTTHIDSLMVNGEPIPVTETGAFQEPYVLAPGVNRIVFDAKDPYGNKAEKVVEIVYTPPATSTIPVTTATSTPENTSSSSTDSTYSPQADPIAPAQ